MAGIDMYDYSYDSVDPRMFGTVHQKIPRPNNLNLPLSLPIVPEEEVKDNVNSNYEETIKLSAEIVNFITKNLLSHPFVVLRRQCQVHPASERLHLLPFSLVPVVIHLHQTQNFTTLWKGVGSSLLVEGMRMAVEDSLSKFTPWPKDIILERGLQSFGQHIALKCVSLAIITPFYSASLVETVQSDIASEKPGVLDVFKEGLCRIVSWGSPIRGRMLSVWALMGPTVLHGICKHLIYWSVSKISAERIRSQNKEEQHRRGALYKDQAIDEDSIEVSASFLGLVASEVICFPLETILHRLHLQGTRTIVDNLDSGTEVIAIRTAYQGFSDCFSSVLSSEGISGLYKGFGALILQLSVHWAVLKLIQAEIFKRRPPPPSRPHPTPVNPNTPKTVYQSTFDDFDCTPLGLFRQNPRF